MLLIKNAELNAYKNHAVIADVRCANGLITEISSAQNPELTPQVGEQVIDANGAALLPGLHDHHIHLFSLAAAQASVICGPPSIQNKQQLKETLKKKSGENWLRGIHYHESVAGVLDRRSLDKLINDRPARIQHRSGILWILNSCAIEQLHIKNERVQGLERNSLGELTGRLFRLDHWLRKKIGAQDIPNLRNVSQQLAHFGITGLTDTSADNDAFSLALFEKSVKKNELLQGLVLMGNENLPKTTNLRITRGALKILLDEPALPDAEQLKFLIQNSHAQNRPVAFHCVTETELIFALSILKDAGSIDGDRIEHASLCQNGALPLLKETGISVVTQIDLLRSRGEQYQQTVEIEKHPYLYRGKFFIDNKIPFALSSDAPYGDINPWRSMHTAIQRSNLNKYIFGEDEALTAEQALCCYLKNPLNLNQERKIIIGESADLCLLNKSWKQVKNNLHLTKVHKTIIGGKVIL